LALAEATLAWGEGPRGREKDAAVDAGAGGFVSARHEVRQVIDPAGEAAQRLIDIEGRHTAAIQRGGGGDDFAHDVEELE
jgi:hypothetical protein